MRKIFPKDYKSQLNEKETEKAIKFIKDTFEKELSGELKLSRITSPLFVPKNSGINDDLNGIERPVTFPIGKLNDMKVEVVQSLAKWKRLALSDYGYQKGYGIYTDMNALRPDDDLDCIHSIYVDQWDWELVIDEKDRNLDFLKKTVRKIYEAMKRTEFLVGEHYTYLKPILPDEITFIHSEDALKEFPNLSPEEREKKLAKKYGAIFIIGIGKKLDDDVKHGNRSPDYDDFTTKTSDYTYGLNGDIIVWDSVRNDSLELSSMGIRVNKEVLLNQLEYCNALERKDLYWHKRLLNDEFEQTIGGGIGQSRLCMFLLQKAHIGEVQASIWPKEVRDLANKKGIKIL